jgi:hypothetical protein
VAFFASLALGFALPSIVSPLDRGMPAWWDGITGLVMNFALPLILLLPFALVMPLLRDWRGSARRLLIAVTCTYGIYATPFAVIAIHRLAVAARDQDAELRPVLEAMREGPEAAARRDADAGQRGFLGVAELAVTYPGVKNSCVLARLQPRVIIGTSDVIQTPAQAQIQERAAGFAERYNTEMARLLWISPVELGRDDRCAGIDGAGYWPSRPRRGGL